MRKIKIIVISGLMLATTACGSVEYHPVRLADNTAQCRIRAVNNVENPNTFGNINSSLFNCRVK